MVFYRRWLLIFCALLLGGGQLLAAPSREDRAYAAAASTFQTGMWSSAEGAFAKFVQNYPKSTNAPLAVLLEAQAQFNQKKFGDATALLTARKPEAGQLADQYTLWIGEAQFAAKSYAAAAATFTALANNFPDSTLRLRAAVEAAAAYGQLQQWSDLSALLAATNGVFARQTDLDAANELVSRGRLLLAQACFAQNDFTGAASWLQTLNPQTLKPGLDWQREYLLCQVKTAAGEPEAALIAATNLSRIAQLEKNDAHRAESVVLRAGLLEKLGRPADALAAYQDNLAAGTPVEKQRAAVLKIVELAAQLKQFSLAEQSLDNFLRQFPDSPAADIALLTSGELQLKEYVLLGATNRLPLAQVQFDRLLTNYPDGPLAGKALLDRGWCWWLATSNADSLADFQAAAEKELLPVDRAVAKFKAGDILFAQGDFAGALANYRAVFPEVQAGGLPPDSSAERDLAARALYQGLRACLELNDTNGAAQAFANIFAIYSAGELGQGSALLYGESLADPQQARSLFQRLAPKFSGSPLEPQLKLAIARTYEQAPDWAAAVTNYEGWVRDFPTNNLRPQADYALALANYQAGNETEALSLFTHFVAQYPADPLAPQAQWWVAEHFFRLGGDGYIFAETNYEMVFQNPVWKNSALYYPAQLMAGRAAMGRTGYKDAVGYFTQLFSDTNCPGDLQVEARFACGAALMTMNSSDTNAMLANLVSATNLFSQIVQLNPTNNDLPARAWGEIGDCTLQLGDFVAATNAYAQVFGTNSPAGISARSRAQVGTGLVLEKMAALAADTNQASLFNQLALQNYLSVFDTWTGNNLRDGESADAWWVKQAGWRAAPLVAIFDGPAVQKKFYARLQAVLPALSDTIQKKIDALPPEKK